MAFWSKIFRGKRKNITFDGHKKSELGIPLTYEEKCNKCGYNFLVEYELCDKNYGGGEIELECLNCGKGIAIIIPKGRIFKDTFWPIG